MDLAANFGRSDWGLFACARRLLESEASARASECRFWLDPPLEGCDGSISILKPIEGAGTELFHGDFARRMSPSCEALAWHLLHHRGALANRRVLELGSGLGFTGLACAAWTEAASVQLTDGDPVVVQTLRRSLEMNQGAFGDTAVDAQVLLWETSARAPPEEERYDVIIAGDVVYLDVGHTPLLATMRRWLRRGGSIYLMASKRNGSLERFVELAKSTFPWVRMSADYDPDVARTFAGMKCFPWLVRLSPDVAMESVPSFAQRVVDQSRERLAQAKQQAEEEAQQRAVAESAQRRRRDELAAKHRGEFADVEVGRSEWGFFSCERQLHDPGGEPDYRAIELRFRLEPPKWGCEAAVSLVKPLEGAGVDLAFGDGARKVSPSAEALAWFLLRRRRALRGKRVLELGAGLGLTGFAIAVWSEASCVRLTDGDPTVVRTLQRSIALNKAACGETEVSAEVLPWEADKRTLPEGVEPFDVVIAAEVVDVEEGFLGILATLRRWVKPNGIVFLCGSKRAGNMDRFIKQASFAFPVVQPSVDYDSEVSQRFSGMACFPVLVKMSNPELSQVGAPESGLAAFGQAVEEARLQRSRAERRARREARRRRAANRAHRRQRDRLVAQREERQKAADRLAELPPPLQEGGGNEEVLRAAAAPTPSGLPLQEPSPVKQCSRSSRGGGRSPQLEVASASGGEERPQGAVDAESCSSRGSSDESSGDESSEGSVRISSRLSEGGRSKGTPTSCSSAPPTAACAVPHRGERPALGITAPHIRRSASVGCQSRPSVSLPCTMLELRPHGEAHRHGHPPRLPATLKPLPQAPSLECMPQPPQLRKGGGPLLHGHRLSGGEEGGPLPWPRADERLLPFGSELAKANGHQRSASVDSIFGAHRALAPVSTVNLCLPPLAIA